mmetsp:Transcript_9614/g.13218  ORF Transcript_9614/g.13218 Transcript_9614/m.13218 type:complete len:261 (-) Transcript_9614:185-967(-)
MLPKLRTKISVSEDLLACSSCEKPLRGAELGSTTNISKAILKRCDICQIFTHAKCLVEKNERLQCLKCLRPKRYRKYKAQRSKRRRKMVSPRRVKRTHTESSGISAKSNSSSFAKAKMEGHMILDDMDTVIRDVERLDKYEHSIQRENMALQEQLGYSEEKIRHCEDIIQRLEHENWSLRNELTKYDRIPYYTQPIRARSSMQIVHRSPNIVPATYVKAVYPGYRREGDVHSNYVPPHDGSVIGTAMRPKEDHIWVQNYH